MKITQIETFAVQPRWLFVKVSTDEGLVGWGECLGDKALVGAEAVRSYAHHVLGEEPERIIHHWQKMFRGAFWRGGPTLCAAISGIEMALWDIHGKRLGVPVWQLLGGRVRDRIRVYTHFGGNSPEEFAANARRLVERGFTAMKTCPFKQVHIVDHYSVVEQAAANVAAAREAVGNGVDIMLDFHGRVSPTMAMWMEEAIRPYHPLFIEEPVLPENVEALAQFTRKARTPIATGERLFTKWAFRDVLEKGAASIVQPDPCICGGIWEARQIASLAECWYAAVAPHNPYGPLNFAACLQIDACTPNFLVQEYIDPIGLGNGYLKTEYTVKDGYIDIPTLPGLGVEVDEEAVRAAQFTEQFDPGRWFHTDDGSVADW